ncbi:hypothetical protein Dda_4460 [Drechslerella dactyloides]|uniref:Uncharacterized protein n=1 Tax=Drechslerella dactyloides TaxID=74499 RepID=A0AAD6J157_DREDA|nr:hypothetical protein Dda_4460 [Drechslerella dactyloides]
MHGDRFYIEEEDEATEHSDNMFLKALVIGSSFVALAASAECNADNCLRALRPSTRTAQASIDCTSFFAIPTVTYTDTLSFSETSTAKTTITETSVIELTATSVVEATSTKTVDLGTVSTLTTFLPIRKRAAPTLPSYASACSGAIRVGAAMISEAARYASACSCLGVTSPTVTPSTTVTVSTTFSFSTTETITETTSISTVVATETSTDLDVVTKTISAIATATLKPFKIEVTYPANSGAGTKYLIPFIRFPSSNPVYYTGFVDTIGAGATYILDGTTIKTLSPPGYTLSCQTGTTWGWVYSMFYSGSSTVCVCAIDPTSSK